ncbi:MAG TPA: DUF881 domain-containing protein [Bacillota bacterium]
MRRGGAWAVALVSMVLGVMLAVQIKVQHDIRGPLTFGRSEEISVMLQQTENERNLLRQEVATLREQLTKAAEGQQSAQALQDALLRSEMMAGATAVKGPGVKLVLDDSKTPRQQGEDPNLFVLHDDDLLKVVNELRAAGAEAVSINGQRLVARSEIRCAGPTISINNTRTAPPVEILAIGDPATLESALRMRGGVLDQLGFWKIDIKLSKVQELTIPAYNGPLQFVYAKPAKGGEPK